jgi:hypothetical protein
MGLKEEFAKLTNEVKEIVSTVKNQTTIWKNAIDAQVQRLEDWKNNVTKKTLGSTVKYDVLNGGSKWNRVLKINHRNTYRISVFTTGGNYAPGIVTFYVTTSYAMTDGYFDANSVSTIHKKYNYATKVRFTADDVGHGYGYLDIYCVGHDSFAIHLEVEDITNGGFEFVTPIVEPELLEHTTQEVEL